MKYIFLFIAFISVNNCFSQKDPVQVLSKYIQIKSISGNEKPAGIYMQQLSRSLGLHTNVFFDTDSCYNFSASLLPLDGKRPSILFINHLDVVPVDEKGLWAHPAFSGKISNDTIYGRGAIDMKGLAVMQLFALKQLKDSLKTDSLKYNVVILFLSGEETGGLNGAAKIVLSPILQTIKPAVVFGEGGGGLTHVIPGKENDLCFFVSNSEKKSLWLKLEATVKSHGHGSVPSSKTANKLLLKAIQKIESTEEKIVIDKNSQQTFKALGTIIGGTKGFVVKHINWWIFKPFRKKIFNDNQALKVLVTNSYQLTQIQNPTGAINQVAQTASAYYDCRLLPNKSEKPLLMKLLFRILDPRIKVTVVDESPEAEASNLNVFYGHMKTALQSVFPKAHVLPVMFPATTDNSYFRSVNIESYGVLPFQLTQEMMESVHSSNERLPVRALKNGIDTYVTFLKLCLQ